MNRFLEWLFRMKPKCAYTFQHEDGPTHTVHARSLVRARLKMKKFLAAGMYGDWAMAYYPEAVEREMKKCRLLSSPAGPLDLAADLR